MYAAAVRTFHVVLRVALVVVPDRYFRSEDIESGKEKPGYGV